MDIHIHNITKGYGSLTVLDHFSLTLTSGNRHCLFGPSGCGKTTLLNCITGLESFDTGQIEGVDRKQIAYVFQEERLLPWLTVKENVTFVLKGKDHARNVDDHVESVLELVELTAFKDHYPKQLSGGMKQRVSLARAFAYQADMLILDEPFKGLHHDLKQRLMDYVLAYWALEKPHLIFTTHDVDEALYLATDIFVMEGPPAQIKAHVILDEKASPSIRFHILNLLKRD